MRRRAVAHYARQCNDRAPNRQQKGPAICGNVCQELINAWGTWCSCIVTDGLYLMSSTEIATVIHSVWESRKAVRIWGRVGVLQDGGAPQHSGNGSGVSPLPQHPLTHSRNAGDTRLSLRCPNLKYARAGFGFDASGQDET